MNRIALVFTAVFVSLSFGFADDLINTNIVGATGLPGQDAYKVIFGQSYIGGSSLTGGAATSPVDDIIANNALGGNGLFLVNVSQMNIDSWSTMRGGRGGDMNFSGQPLSSVIEAYGGLGISTLISANLNITNSSVFGGDGGSIVAEITSGSEVFDVSGGEGVLLRAGMLSLNNVDVIGGKGGSIITSGADASSTANGGIGVSVVNSSFVHFSGGTTIQGGIGGSFDSGGSIAVANGGDGLVLSGISGSITIENVTLSGGIGGTVSGSEGSSATGGSGFKVVDSADVTISDGTYSGGIGGTVNGILDADGNAINIVDSNVDISGGKFTGNVILSGSGASILDISGGEFLGDILFSGSGTTALKLQNSLTNLSGSIRQADGTANINLWDDSHFVNTTISGGTMNFNNRSFNLGNGSSFTLQSQDSLANFNGGIDVLSGGTLDVGLGRVNTPDFKAEAGSQLLTTYDGTTNGIITGESLTFENGVKWTIDGGANAVGEEDEFTLATATSIVSSIDISDVSYVGSGGNWLEGIDRLTNSTLSLIAVYGTADLNRALGVEDSDSEYGKAMADWTDLLLKDGDMYGKIKRMTRAQGTQYTQDLSVRTPEVANVLIQLPGIFSDQIKDRTRSYRRYQNGKSVAGRAPLGAQGPAMWDNSMGWLNNHLPKWDARETLKEIDAGSPRPESKVDGSEPPPKARAHARKASRDKIEVPETYQVWGRGYGSFVEQDATTGFTGYDAGVVGGVLGLDKSFNNLLLGIGGGYAYTVLDGKTGNDAKADTGYGTVYGAINGERGYLDANFNYARNDVETTGRDYYTGEYDASTTSFYIGGGLGFSAFKDTLLFTPEASLLTTYYARDSYTEKSADGLMDKEWDSYSQWSYLGSLGATLSMIGQIDSFSLDMEFRPEVRVHWLHEFNADMDNPVYMMMGAANSIDVSLQAREEDLVKIGTGVRFSKWDSDTLEFGFDLDGIFGPDYAAYMVSGKLLHRF